MLPKLVLLPGRCERAHGIAEELKNKELDIIVFQVAFLPTARKIITDVLGLIYPYQYGPANNTFHIKSSSGVWIISKLPLKVLREIEFKQCADMDRLVRKGAIILEGNFDGQTFQLATTHLQANANRHSIRIKQLQSIRAQLLQPFLCNGIPQFVCGDMNIRIDHISHYQEMLKALDATNGPITGKMQYTYNGFENTIVRNLGYKDVLTTFDYMLIRFNNADVNCVRNILALKHNNKDLSDHYCLQCLLNWD
jgi:endonuclease/exonuclease/phosphatase family metal-dependent hydrolase